MKSNKSFDRNYWAFTLDGAAFMGGLSMMTSGGVVALFIDTMTGSKTLVGLAITFQILFLLIGQLIIAPQVGAIKNIPRFMVRIALLRVLPLFITVPLFLGADGRLSVFIFLVFYGLFWLSDGFNTIPWGELCARALKPDLRGHMMGMHVALGGVLTLLTGLLLAWLLATPLLTDSQRFGVIFLTGGIILLSSVIFVRMLKDPSPITVPEKPGFRKYYSKLPALIKQSKPLQHAIISRIPGYIGFSTITFIVVFGRYVLEITNAQVSWLVYSQLIGTLIGGYILGEASRRFGNKTVIIMCNVGVLVTLGMAIALAYFPALGYIWLFSLCAFASIWMNQWLGYFNYFLDIAPRVNRPAYQVIGSCIGIPFSFIGYAIGATIDKWGYITAFIIGIIAAVVSILVSFKLLSKKSIKELNLPT